MGLTGVQALPPEVKVKWRYPRPPHREHVRHVFVHPDDPRILHVCLEHGGIIRSFGSFNPATPNVSPFGVILTANANQPGRTATVNNSGTISGLLGMLANLSLESPSVSTRVISIMANRSTSSPRLPSYANI